MPSHASTCLLNTSVLSKLVTILVPWKEPYSGRVTRSSCEGSLGHEGGVGEGQPRPRPLMTPNNNEAVATNMMKMGRRRLIQRDECPGLGPGLLFNSGSD